MPIGKIVNRRNDTHITGKIKLGYKKTSERTGKKFPVETDYFVIDPENPENRGLIKKYGLQPRQLDILFTSDDEEYIAPSYLKMYKCSNPHEEESTKRRTFIACKGKGLDPNTGEPTIAFYRDNTVANPANILAMTPEIRSQLEKELEDFTVLLNDPNMTIESRGQILMECNARKEMLVQNPRVRPRACCHDACPDFGAGGCKGVMDLSFKIPLGDIFGEYTISTGSTIAMQNILNCIQDVKANIKRFRPDLPFGRIAGVPLILSRVRKQTRFFNQATGKEEFSEHFPLKMTVNHDFKEYAREELAGMVAAIMFDSPISPKMLPAPDAPEITLLDTEFPDDLYPTPEECALAREEKEQDLKEADAAIQDALSAKEEWINDENIKPLLDAWEKKLGRAFPEGKRRAFIKGFTSKEEAVIALKGKIGDAPAA